MRLYRSLLGRSHPAAPPRLGVGDPAPPIRGADLTGSPVEVPPGPGRTVIYFLTSSCRSCQGVWADLAAGMPGVAVTPDAATEDRRRLRKLAGPATTVVMSTDAWLEYGTGPAPWQVVVEGGVVVSTGTPLTS